jgi:HSP20 family protein
MAIGPDGRPKVREFGNVKPSSRGFGGGMTRPEISGETEPLVDVSTTDKEVKVVVVEMTGISKNNIKINAYDSTLEVKSEDPKRGYHKTVKLPPKADIETAKSAYNNMIWEITFKKKDKQSQKENQ